MKEFEIKKRIIGFFRQSSGGFVSGEEISGALGFSRASAWKYIEKLRDEGYEIEAVPHLGYRLRGAPDKLYGYDTDALSTKVFGRGPIYFYETISSTNDKAYELAESGEKEGTIVIAEAQTKGKGRVGRKWVSPKGEGIYLSIILRPDAETDEVPALTLIAASSIIKAIEKTCGLKGGMKWPNDVFIGGKKVCGVLTEMKAQPDAVDFLVLGIGINVNTPLGKLPPEGTSLKLETSCHVKRTELLKNVLEKLEKSYFTFKKKGFKPLRGECKKLSLVLGNQVKIVEHHHSITGKALDIDEKGALIVRTDKGKVQRVFSGDVVLCR